MTMTAEVITIEEAGEVHENAGHFHVIADDGCVEPGAAVARDANHVHFGTGGSEGTIYLTPGTHELCQQAGDGAHVEFPVRQVSYENIRRLIAQLQDALDQVDTTARDLVATSLTSADSIAEAFTTATDEQDAERLIQPIFEAVGEDGLNGGAPWILDNCGVDIDG